MCWYVIVLDGEIAHLGAVPHATKALAESCAAAVLAQRQAEGLGFPHALLEMAEPPATTNEARWYVLELVERLAFVSERGPFDTEAEAREVAVRGYALWALLRVHGLLRAPPSQPRRRSRSLGSRARSREPMARLHGGPTPAKRRPEA